MKITSQKIKIRRTWGSFNPLSRIHDGRGKTGRGYSRAKSQNWKRDLE